MENNQLVMVGATHWVNPEWQRGFYPEDLPEDWMLSYYNTQFQAVYLSATMWRTVSEATWAQWINDTQDGFVFVLEQAGEAELSSASGRVLMATPAWGKDHVWWLDEVPDMRALSQRISKQAAIGESLFVISRSGDLGLMQQVNALKQVMGY